MISGDEARQLEPMLTKDIIGAMYAPATGVISPLKLVLNAGMNAAENGVCFCFDTLVENIEKTAGGYRSYHESGEEDSAGTGYRHDDSFFCRHPCQHRESAERGK